MIHSDDIANKFIQKTIEQLEDGSFDLIELTNELERLEEGSRNTVVDRLAWANKAPRVLRNQPVGSLKYFFDYLSSKKYFDRHTHREIARSFIEDIQDNKEILLYLLENIKLVVAHATEKLTKTDDGITEIEKITIRENISFRRTVALGLGEVIAPGFSDPTNLNGYVSINRDAHPKVAILLNNLVGSTDSVTSYIASVALNEVNCLYLESVEKLLQSSDYRQKKIGLEYYEKARVKVKDAESQIPLIVELLEDERIDVSKSALKAIIYFSPEYSNLVADTIFDLLVLRSNNRPQEFFNLSTVHLHR